MPHFLAMSFEGDLAPSFDLRCIAPGRKPPDGWGLGYYPGGEASATVLKEPAPGSASIRSELVRSWEHLASPLFLLHIRTATWGHPSVANTQPFSRSWGRRDWLIAHAGSLRQRLELSPTARFEPVGSTDTELVFCELMSRIAEKGWRSLGDIDAERLHAWLADLNQHGSMTMLLTDGRDLAVYADANGEGEVFTWYLHPPHRQVAFGDDDLTVDLSRRGIKSRKGVIVSSSPLGPAPGHDGEQPSWGRLTPGHLLIVRQGSVRAEVGPRPPEAGSAVSTLPLTLRPVPQVPQPASPRRFAISHRTVYRYARAVERSLHTFRLTPIHDRTQSLLEHDVWVSVDGKSRFYDDVFGNRTQRLAIDRPFTEMIIEARSKVEVRDTDPLPYHPLRVRSTIPLVWMPWQRQVLQPFLLPPELAESELSELIEYAMSFVERNDYDLIDTLLDINAALHAEYEYRQGATTLSTTPFETYVHRRGVCQDFTNLFICLARILGIPARYACGYIFTGPKNPNQIQSEASHAWVQVYLPEVGWKGFDPTNGILTQTDHVRVAYGRNFVDATPTAGTIYVGGGGETLEVQVTVEPID